MFEKNGWIEFEVVGPQGNEGTSVVRKNSIVEVANLVDSQDVWVTTSMGGVLRVTNMSKEEILEQL